MIVNRVCINECMKGHRAECEETETHKSCQPAEATRGLLCEKCFESLQSALTDAPEIVHHLRNIFGILSSRAKDGSKRTRREPPAPINLSAFELSENIFETIVGIKIKSKDSASHVVSELSKSVDEKLQSFESFVNDAEVKHVLPVIKIVRAAKKLFPMSEVEQKTAMPCPECDLLTIYTPPQSFGDTMKVSCQSCGFEVPPDKIAFYAHLAEKGKK